MQGDLYHYDSLFIGGEWVKPATDKVIEVESPSTEEIIGVVPAGSIADMESAIKAARNAFDHSEWPGLPMVERAKYLRAIADAMAKRYKDFAYIGADECGLPTGFMSADGGTHSEIAVHTLNYYADLAEKYQLEELRQGVYGKVLVRKEPMGVVGIITPWNAPIVIGMFSVAPALLSGCTVVMKPASLSPLHAQLLAQVCEEIGLPPGVFNVVPADRDARETLVRHPDVDKIVFTGSTEVGRRIGMLCGEQFKRFGLELGGKSAAIILEDANLDQVMPMVTFTGFMNNGEACVGQTRILAHRSRYDEVVETLAAFAKAYKVGDPRDPETTQGPLIDANQRATGEMYIQSGLEQGAKLVAGGKRPANLDRGYYLEPTVFANVDMNMRIAREEIFCPVLSVIPFENDEDALAIANDSTYGLSGTVWTSDRERGLAIARRVRTGNYGLNCFSMDVAAPFGGYKTSGMGRQLGPEGLDSMFELKSIHLAAEQQ